MRQANRQKQNPPQKSSNEPLTDVLPSDFDIRPLRGGAGRGSTRSSRYDLDTAFFCPEPIAGILKSIGAFFFPRGRSELGGGPPWRCGAGFNSEFLLRDRSKNSESIFLPLVTPS